MSDDTFSLQISPLESDILERFHRAYSEKSFPAAIEIKVKSRENTGAGRYTYLDHVAQVDLPNGFHGVGKYCQFDMEGLPSGACYMLFVEDQKIKFLEIVVNGDHEWDGSEREWTMRDPKTGSLPE